MPGSSKRSKVWDYFIYSKRTHWAKCIECDSEINSIGSSTSLMRKHLLIEHKLDLKETKANIIQPETDTSSNKRKLQPTISDYVGRRSAEEVVSELVGKDGFVFSAIANSLKQFY